MLTVDEQGFEQIWGPRTIKPLNFNYEFQPTFVGQNIWTLTDNLFVPNHKRQDEEANDDFMKVVYSKLRNVKGEVQKKSSRYKQFPTIDQDIHQKSSSAQGSYVSRRLKIVGSPLSSSSKQSPRTPSKPVLQVVKKVAKYETTGKILRPQVQSTRKFVGKKQPVSPLKFALKKRQQQSGLTLKLSQQETERLLKSLDFKVRTVRKPKPNRDRSKSEALRKENGFVKIAAQKRLSVSKVESNKPRSVKKSDPKNTRLENQGLLKSSKMSSSEKNSRSSSGLNELVGPLPKVNWTQSESIHQKNGSSSSLKKKSSEKPGDPVGKGSKTSTNSKKLGKNPSSSQNFSREPSTEEHTISHQKVKTTRVKIIPKITLNNQLLKSTTLKTEVKLVEKKNVGKAPPKKKEPKAKADSVLWTPEKIALLDQITNDQQLKAVLMSAGDTYMKSRKYFAVKSNVKAKPPVKQASSVMKKESTDTKKITNAVVNKNPSTAKPTNNKQGDVDIPKPVSKEETSVGSDTLDVSLATLASKNEASKVGKSPETNVKSVKRGEPNQIANSQLLKTEGLPKTAKTPKSPARKVANYPTALKESKTTNPVVANKKRNKYAINSKEVRKVEERLAQLSAEVTGNSRQVQDKKVSQVQRTNLDHLRKIIDKSLTKFKEDNKAGEIKSD